MRVIGLGFFLFVLTTTLNVSRSNEIALTFDDAPMGDGWLYSGKERGERLRAILQKHKITAAFFINTDKMSDSERTARVEAYAKAGHIIGNHSHSHMDPRKNPVEKYLKDIDLAHEKLKDMFTFKLWFRYPYLAEGSTLSYRDEVRKHLKKLGYKNAYVTVDNYDYYLNDLVLKAKEKGKNVDLTRACQMLVDLMWKGIEYYDSLAQKHIGKVRHVLLMHENDMAALCLEELITFLHKKNWQIISPDRAYEDPLMGLVEPDTLYLNQGRVAALVHEKTGVRYRAKWESGEILRGEFKKRQIVKLRP